MISIHQIQILSLIVFLPLVGGAIVFIIKDKRWFQPVALATTIATFALTLVPMFMFKSDQVGFQFVEYLPWIESLGISYHLGIDGLSLFLLPLTGFLSVMAILVSWNKIKIKVKMYYITFLILETGMLGVFTALDGILFYIFWETMLVPMFLIIGIWGSENRRYASIKFLIYTVAGSVFLLVGLIVMAILNQKAGGGLSFNMLSWLQLSVPSDYQYWLFAFFFVAFAVKVPIFPFHTWLPDAHVQAPTAGSVILAGVLLKMGIYGILRFCFPLFPDATLWFTPFIIALGLIGVIYGAVVAFAQQNMKKLVAYSSVSHMGLIVVGIMAGNMAGIKGGIIQMLNHGLSTGALFILVGAIYERKKTLDMDKLGGLAGRIPVLSTFFVIMVLSSIGLPGLNGFVGELLLLMGTFQYEWWVGALAGTTLILGAVYMLRMTQRVLFEKDRSPEVINFTDFTLKDKMVMIPIVLLVLLIGIYPSYFTKRMETVSQQLISTPISKSINAPVSLKNGQNEFIKVVSYERHQR